MQLIITFCMAPNFIYSSLFLIQKSDFAIDRAPKLVNKATLHKCECIMAAAGDEVKNQHIQ